MTGRKEQMSLKVHVMVILMGGFISGLPVSKDEGGDGKLCPPGKYMSVLKECINCEEDFFTSKLNKERSCHPCFRDCTPDMHMQVVKKCTRQSDIECRCMTGFVCRKYDDISHQCTKCEPNLEVTTNSTIGPPSNTLAPLHSIEKHALWILALMLAILLTIIVTLLFCRRRKKECLKQLVKRCSLGNQKLQEDCTSTPSEINKTIKESHTQEMISDTFNSSRSESSTHHPASTEQPPTAGSLGPLHIYGAGTVFVSLLNQFGQNGGEKDEEDLGQQALDMNEIHGPASPPLPLSMEERSRDGLYVSFPSQEQGKECHMSKEEGL